METISHRELRNNSGAILQAVLAGDSYTVTNNGTPVALLRPIDGEHIELRASRPARIDRGFSTLPRVPADTTVAQALDELRDDR